MPNQNRRFKRPNNTIPTQPTKKKIIVPLIITSKRYLNGLTLVLIKPVGYGSILASKLMDELIVDTKY